MGETNVKNTQKIIENEGGEMHSNVFILYQNKTNCKETKPFKKCQLGSFQIFPHLSLAA